MENNFRQEALVFGKYLVGQVPDEHSIGLYSDAMKKAPVPLSVKEQRLVRFMVRNKWSVGLVDAALAMFGKNSNVRRKLFVMLAILEVSPAHVQKFIPGKTPALHAAWAGARSVLKSFLGFFLIRLI